MTQPGPTLAISQAVDAEKYRLPGESFPQSIERLVSIVPEDRRQPFYDLLLNQRFLPAGRIRNAVGSPKLVTAFNCYVMKDIPDSLEGIMDILKDGAMTMKQGGGTGYNFSLIRPKDAWIKSVGSRASGPISYMHMYDKMCATVKSAGERRGAMMFVLRIDHPDIEDYITVKTEQGVLTNANLSVAVTNRFMDAVVRNQDFDLEFEGQVYKTVKARELWDKLMAATWDWAEPGILFIDRINQANNLWYVEEISATNPCGEQPLPADGACLLGSMNLTKYVSRTDQHEWVFNYQTFAIDVALAVNYLDLVIDNTIYPLPDQEQEAKNKRRMGLGVTGVANAIERLGHAYGSPEFLAVLERILTTMRDSAYIASVRLAKEKGPFPLYHPVHYLGSEFIQTLPTEIRTLIGTYGIRNSHLLSIAPTGTISLCADNISSGIEPVFTHAYNRDIIMASGNKVNVEVTDYAYREWGLKGRTALELTPQEHVAVLATAQKYIDSAVSKTINIGDEVTYEEFKSVYLDAYQSGAKGCTTFRAKGKRMGILTEKKIPDAADGEGQEVNGTNSERSDFDWLVTENGGEACTFDPVTGRKSCE